jgi:hypothetical protein
MLNFFNTTITVTACTNYAGIYTRTKTTYNLFGTEVARRTVVFDNHGIIGSVIRWSRRNGTTVG